MRLGWGDVVIGVFRHGMEPEALGKAGEIGCRQGGHVAGRGHLPRGGKPVRVQEAAAAHAQFLGLLIHGGNEGVHGPVQVFRHGDARVVSRHDGDPLKEFLKGDFVPQFHEHLGPAGLPGRLTDVYGIVQFQIALFQRFENQVERQDLGE